MKNLTCILILAILLISFNTNYSYGQNYTPDDLHYIDSLSAITTNPESPDTSIVGAYNDLTGILGYANSDTIIPLSKQALKHVDNGLKKHPNLAVEKKLLSGKASALNNLGYAYDQKGKIIESISMYSQSLQIFEKLKDKKGQAYALNNLGTISSGQEDPEKAMSYFFKALKLYEDINLEQGVAMTLNNIGVAFQSMYNRIDSSSAVKDSLIAEAINYNQKAYDVLKTIENNYGMATVINNLGVQHKNQALSKKLSKTQRDSILDIALNEFNQAIFIRTRINHQVGISESLGNAGNIFLQRKLYNKAEKNGIEALSIAQEINSPEYIERAARLLSKVYQEQGRGIKALEMFQLHISMRDSLNNVETQKATIQQELKYEYEKKKALDDVKNEKLIAIEKEEKEKQIIITTATAGGLGLVIIFLTFVFNRLRVTKKQKIIIEEQKEEVEEAHKEITDSINYAERIQRSFLATKDILDTNLKDYFVLFKPKDVVSGDFYWAGHLENGNFAVVNADSTGHGVPGAIMSILNISSIEKAIEQGENEPSEIFNKTRSTIIERLKKDGSKNGGKDGMDASIVCFDFEKNKFLYTAANNPIWVIRNNELTIIKPDKMPIGKHENDKTSFSQGEFNFQKGDQIYTLTDGFQDQFGGPKGKKFMIKKMREYVLSISHLPMKEQHKKLNEIFNNWKGEHEQVDDVCVIGVRI